MASKSGSRTRPYDQAAVLQKAARHVRYEMEMLSYSAFYIPHGLSSPEIPETRNIALESFLLHFRNLTAFLCPSLQKTRCDDVIASDYLYKAAPEDIGDAAELGVDRIRINKLLAHLSYDRAEYETRGDKTWRSKEMVQRMDKGMIEFFRLLPNERHAWFEKR